MVNVCSYAGITCDVADRGVVYMQRAQVRITVYEGDSVTCTFVNELWAAILGRVYQDNNANGSFENGEPGLKDWWLTLYNAAGTQVRRYKTIGTGKTNFWTLAPGSYTLCGEVRPGWWNTQPGTADSAFGNQPCYAIEAVPGGVTEAYFGYARQAPATLRSAAAADGLFQYPNPYVVDSDEESTTPFVDPDIDKPLCRGGMYLPMITR